jgi:hypothetical protein
MAGSSAAMKTIRCQHSPVSYVATDRRFGMPYDPNEPSLAAARDRTREEDWPAPGWMTRSYANPAFP